MEEWSAFWAALLLRILAQTAVQTTSQLTPPKPISYSFQYLGPGYSYAYDDMATLSPAQCAAKCGADVTCSGLLLKAAAGGLYSCQKSSAAYVNPVSIGGKTSGYRYYQKQPIYAKKFISCKEVSAFGISQGFVMLNIPGVSTFLAYCSYKRLLAQKNSWYARGLLGFQRNWTDYQTGFGDIKRAFWIGNDFLHRLTSLYPLRISFEARPFFQNESFYSSYWTFNVANETDNYQLVLGQHYNGTYDIATQHNNTFFTTQDRDNDESALNCAAQQKGGFWYRDCLLASPNGYSYNDSIQTTDGILLIPAAGNISMKYMYTWIYY